MCNLYSMTRNVDAIRRLFRIAHNRSMQIEQPLQAINPSETAPIVRRADDGERELVPMSWGFVRLEPNKGPRRVMNIRDDKALLSPFWKSSFELRRCLVPASSYSEPQGRSPATWHWFGLKGDEPRPLFAFPGVWRHWDGPVKKNESADIDVFAFMTTLPNSLTATINHDRMPVLLTEETEFETWLTGSPREAIGLVRSFEPERMRIVQRGLEKMDLLGGDEAFPLAT